MWKKNADLSFQTDAERSTNANFSRFPHPKTEELALGNQLPTLSDTYTLVPKTSPTSFWASPTSLLCLETVALYSLLYANTCPVKG